MGGTASTSTEETITATWRAESARLVGALTRMTRDLDLAEDLAQDALVSALEVWPVQGVPDNPGAWLMTTAKRRAVDTFRRADTLSFFGQVSDRGGRGGDAAVRRIGGRSRHAGGGMPHRGVSAGSPTLRRRQPRPAGPPRPAGHHRQPVGPRAGQPKRPDT